MSNFYLFFYLHRPIEIFCYDENGWAQPTWVVKWYPLKVHFYIRFKTSIYCHTPTFVDYIKTYTFSGVKSFSPLHVFSFSCYFFGKKKKNWCAGFYVLKRLKTTMEGGSVRKGVMWWFKRKCSKQKSVCRYLNF